MPENRRTLEELKAAIEKECATKLNEMFVEVYESITHHYQPCINQNGNNFELLW